MFICGLKFKEKESRLSDTSQQKNNVFLYRFPKRPDARIMRVSPGLFLWGIWADISIER